jgi:hypothetical protein
VAPHFELWRGATPVSTSRGKRPAPDLATVVRERQEQVLDLEEIVQRSYSSLGRSRRLIERADFLRRKIAHETAQQESKLSAP